MKRNGKLLVSHGRVILFIKIKIDHDRLIVKKSYANRGNQSSIELTRNSGLKAFLKYTSVQCEEKALIVNYYAVFGNAFQKVEYSFLCLHKKINQMTKGSGVSVSFYLNLNSLA